ncbi:MAG: hypothetical protein V4594_15790 [Bacteroidota bacterium]
MELNDKEFDAAFRKKVFDADPQFEDAAWDKMEQKLRRRDRVILFRRSALVLFALLAGVWGYYALDTAPVAHSEMAGVLQKKRESVVSTSSVDTLSGLKSAVLKNTAVQKNSIVVTRAKGTIAGVERIGFEQTGSEQIGGGKIDVGRIGVGRQLIISGKFAGMEMERIDLSRLSVTADVRLSNPPMIVNPAPVIDQAADKKAARNKRNLPVSMAISAGPEFNSASMVVGGDPGFSAGLTFGFGITKKLDLLTGARYSLKKYNSGPGLRYSFPNTAAWAKYTLTNLDATCAVLEIPLQASYNIMNNSKNMINLNAGISSYLMLKEDYDFKYNTSYGPTDKLLQKRNANQHLLSIVDLSATYFIKLKSTNLKLGLEPFVKIPLSGVGEGNINLKSSGVSLKLRYDLEKKSN